MNAIPTPDAKGELTIGAAAFKTRCLAILKALEARQLTRVVVTRRGKPVAELSPPAGPQGPFNIWGCMRGTVRVAPGVDLTEPVLDEPLDAELGILHR